ncbi:hypothetical protein ACT4WO_19775 (plasmid) [Acinetobacter baumannii]
MQNDIYIEPVKQSDLSKKIDKYLNFVIALCVLAILICIILTIVDILVVKAGFSNKFFEIKNIQYAIGIVVVVGLIGFFNGTFGRTQIKQEFIYKLVNEAQTQKLKDNIFLILKQNKILTKGELELIQDKMVKELDQMQKSGYREMINTNNSLSEDKLNYINGIKIDIELIKLIISKNEII